MKKILLATIAAVLSLSALAQTATEHLTFKGVPIDGTLKQFVSKMETAGFTCDSIQDGTAVLCGDFAGYKGCMLVVSTLKNIDLVSTIGVMFPECSSWSVLEGTYSKLKEMLTTKYGDPEEVVEEFQGIMPNDDNSRLYELKFDRCIYQTVFRTDKGAIIIRLIHDNRLKCYVLLGYYDRINNLEIEVAAMEDL